MNIIRRKAQVGCKKVVESFCGARWLSAAAATRDEGTIQAEKMFTEGGFKGSDLPSIPGVSGDSGTLARYLYGYALRNGSLQAVEKEVDTIISTAEENPDFESFLATPAIPPKKKREMMESFCTSELSLSDTTTKFFGVMAEIGQLRNTMAMKRAFDKIMMFHNKIVEITVTTAKEWDEAIEKEVNDVLKKMTQEQGVTYRLTRRTDPSIIDGYVFQHGFQVLDLSLRNELRKLEDEIRGGLLDPYQPKLNRAK